MLRVTKLTDYATVVMTVLAARPGEVLSAPDLAEQAGLEAPTVAKVLKPLAAAGLVAGFRGANGGYRLARPAAEIPIAEVVEAADEPIVATRCEDGGPGCLAGVRCKTHDLWAELGAQIRLFLSGMTLADVVDGNIPQPMLQPGPERTQVC